jgi:hypothetical protein
VALATTFALLAGCPARAGDFVAPSVTFARVDWRAAVDQLRTEVAARPEAAGFLTFPSGEGRADPFNRQRAPAWPELNALTSEAFPTIANSPVPVLLPFDVPSFIADRMTAAPSLAVTHYQSGFGDADFFASGPSGYDAVFTLPLGAVVDLPSRVFAKPVEVHLTGSLLTYNIDDSAAGKGEPVKTLANLYPDIRRFIREGFVRYSFTKFGVPYVVSIQCLDSVPRARRLACREASPVAEHFLRSLRVAGGMPARARLPLAGGDLVERPLQLSPDFAYHPPGELIARSSYRGLGGKPDWTVYSQMRFPLQEAPAYVTSQRYLNKDDCGRLDVRCKASEQPPIDETATAAYVWQDSFCESRSFEVWQCPGGWGHQGQDIRPANCAARAERCPPGRHPTVAVRDGVLVRAKTNQAAFVLVNERNEHIRFRYMHMEPGQMDADGVLFGRRVGEGERIGAVSNYLDRENGTNTHLHFDIQVFTRDGWIWVNPYATLVASYEQLLGARGKPVSDLPPIAAPLPLPRPEGTGDHAEAVLTSRTSP